MTQESLFDFTQDHGIEIEIEKIRTATIGEACDSKLTDPICFGPDDVPTMEKQTVLSEIKDLIDTGVLYKSDKYYRLYIEQGKQPHVANRFNQEELFEVWAIPMSDSARGRDIGYGVPSICDHPECNKKINIGLSFVCGGEPYGGEEGCGLFFCEDHLYTIFNEDDSVFKDSVCERCSEGKEPFTPTPDTKEWIDWKLTDESWIKWRVENPGKVKKMKETK